VIAKRRAAARPCGAACTSAPRGELGQTLGEVRWLSFLAICAVLGRPPRMCVLICAKVLSHCCCRSRMAPSCIFRSVNMTIEANVMRLSRRHGLAACFFPSCAPHNPHHGPIRCQSALAQLLSDCWRRAPRCAYRSADMSIEARVIRLSRRQGLAACLWRLLRPTTCLLRVVGRGSCKPRGTTSPTTEGARLTRHLRDGFSCTPILGHFRLKLWCCAFLCTLPRKEVFWYTC